MFNVQGFIEENRMKKLESYLRDFSRLRRGTSQRGYFTEASRNLAPHKPLLLMAVIDLIERSVIESNFISLDDDLVELNELFTGYWRKVMPITQKSSIAYPLFHLKNEPFWSLVSVPGKERELAATKSISSVGQLRDIALGSRMDEDLFLLLQQRENRDALRAVLLQSCFSCDAQKELLEQTQVNSEAYIYNQELLKIAHQPRVKEILESEKYKPAVRDQGFRRAVVMTYDHRCALCGVRIVTSEGHTVVDAAHIVPWSISKNDDIRNGMALCKLCHWAFDEGMMGVSAEYNVITSRQIAANPNVPGLLMMLSDSGIRMPADRDLWPAQKNLRWHRRKWGL